MFLANAAHGVKEVNMFEPQQFTSFANKSAADKLAESSRVQCFGMWLGVRDAVCSQGCSDSQWAKKQQALGEILYEKSPKRCEMPPKPSCVFGK